MSKSCDLDHQTFKICRGAAASLLDGNNSITLEAERADGKCLHQYHRHEGCECIPTKPALGEQLYRWHLVPYTAKILSLVSIGSKDSSLLLEASLLG